MTKDKALELLAGLLAGTTNKDFDNIEDDPNEVIAVVLKQMAKKKDEKPIAVDVKSDVDEVLNEVEDGVTSSSEEDSDNPNSSFPDYYMANQTSLIWDYNYGYPRYIPVDQKMKDWWTIKDLDLTEFEKCDYTCDDCEDCDDFQPVQIIDTQYDIDNGITYKDIALWINSLTRDQLLDMIFEPDEMNAEFFPIGQFEYYDDDDIDMGEYDDDELSDLDEQLKDTIIKGNVNEKQLHEVLDVQARLKKAMRMRSKAKLIAMKRKITMKKHATLAQIQKRARRMARNMLKSKFAGNKPFDELSYNDKIRVEKIVDSKPNLVKTLQTKLIPVVRKLDRERFEHNQLSTSS